MEAFEAMIRHALLYWEVDPNRVYMLGISEGGYGTEALSCRYPDWFAAANGMACGSGTSIHVENLRNLPFRTDVGEKDTMFKRRPNAEVKHKLLEEYRKKDGGGYVHHLKIHQGRGHGINYKPGPTWLLQHKRNPNPDRVVYTMFEHAGVKTKGAYWLQAVNDLEKKVVYLDAKMDRKLNQISIDATATVNDEKVQFADWQQELTDQGEVTSASGLKLRVWLDEKLLDLSKPVKVMVNGMEVATVKPKLSTKTMVWSMKEFGDPKRIYASKLEVVVP